MTPRPTRTYFSKILAEPPALALGLGGCKDSSGSAAKEGKETPRGGAAQEAGGTPLKIAYSDWPSWVAWEIAIKKDWFKAAGLNVEFVWMDDVASMDAYGAGKVDAEGMTNGDALVTGATAKPSVAIVINDY